jgi:hypothetical protein
LAVIDYLSVASVRENWKSMQRHSKSRTNAAARLNAAGECANQLRELRAARKVRGRVHLEAARLELGKFKTHKKRDDTKMNIA